MRAPGQRVALQRAGEAQGPVGAEVLAGVGRATGRPHLAHDLDALAQRLEPVAGTGEAVAVGLPLVLVPAGADAHLEATLGDDVDGGRDLRQVGGVAVAHAGAHLAEPDPAGDAGEGRHEGPGLVGRLLAGPRRGVEVVVDPDRGPVRVAVDPAGQPGHHAPVLRRVDADEVVAPALGDEQSELHGGPLGARARHPRIGRRATQPTPRAPVVASRPTVCPYRAGVSICVVGTSYVGLSLAVLLAEHHDVVAYDIDERRIEMLRRAAQPDRRSGHRGAAGHPRPAAAGDDRQARGLRRGRVRRRRHPDQLRRAHQLLRHQQRRAGRR